MHEIAFGPILALAFIDKMPAFGHLLAWIARLPRMQETTFLSKIAHAMMDKMPALTLLCSCGMGTFCSALARSRRIAD